ncbi:hypothetical protein ACIRPK_20575 [Kitasatospora sp. NPDC101801]|uniref:hypothetical protein n=1 Tax=Bacillati TaxID=1783272 RepID=UPI003801E604
MAKTVKPDAVVVRAYIVLRPSGDEKIAKGDFGTLPEAMAQDWDGHEFELYDEDGETIALMGADVRCEDMRRVKLDPDASLETVMAAWSSGTTVV